MDNIHTKRNITETVSNKIRYVREWTDRQADESEIQARLQPSVGQIYVFPNETLCHAVLPYGDENSLRISTRGDLIFRKI